MRVPGMPGQEAMDKLINAPALSYTGARAKERASGAPVRKFCDMCGYWGKMKCTICGSYVCCLACKQTHDAAEHPHR
ncbi:hypothetical protein BT63DRAFT_427468 [Microthyrium microscopicum]|uniref:HIT-type domain-containing protein n=1 Tax=Microthyrium microscopicum TaxID=703497 RepID=A0A6A6U6Y2_9PEZI|nr:hypothetical protein BT63DRAFT_427468 [Microthyrium microscopicum]